MQPTVQQCERHLHSRLTGCRAMVEKAFCILQVPRWWSMGGIGMVRRNGDGCYAVR